MMMGVTLRRDRIPKDCAPSTVCLHDCYFRSCPAAFLYRKFDIGNWHMPVYFASKLRTLNTSFVVESAE